MRIIKLDGLRGIFSLMIVLMHYDTRLLPEEIASFFLIRESGMFVEFFFVLSGFVISYNYSLLSGFEELKKYIIKRFLRLYPLLFFTTILFFFSEYIINIYFPMYINTPESINSLIFKTIDTLTFMNSTPIFGNGGAMNGPSWSISAEMISYIIFGIITIIFFRKIQILLYLILIFTSIVIFILFHSPEIIDLAFLRGTLSFSIGVLIHRVPIIKFKLPNYSEVLIPIMIIVLMYAINNSENLIEQLHNLISSNFVFFVSIHLLLNSNGFVSKILESPLMQYLGKISYSIYLNHLLVLTIFSRIMFSVIGIDKTYFNMIIIFILSVFLVIIYSKYTYIYVESKVGEYFKKKLL